LAFSASSAHRRALHSFPTRRSSDLPSTIAELCRNWNDDGATQRHEKAVALRKTIQDFPQISALKAVVAHFRNDPEWRRLLPPLRSEEHTSELQSRENLVCRLLLEKK